MSKTTVVVFFFIGLIVGVSGMQQSVYGQEARIKHTGKELEEEQHLSSFSAEVVLLLLGGSVGLFGAFIGAFFKAGAAHQILEQVEKALIPIDNALSKASLRTEEIAKSLQEMKLALVELKHEQSTDRALFGQSLSVLEVATNKKIFDLEKRLEEHQRWLEQLKKDL